MLKFTQLNKRKSKFYNMKFNFIFFFFNEATRTFLTTYVVHVISVLDSSVLITIR